MPRHRLRSLLPATLLSATVVFALAACTTEVAAPAPDPTTPAHSATPTVATSLLTCEDLASPDAVATALTGADGVTQAPVVAVQPSNAFYSTVLVGAGGLACSWRVGAGQETVGTGDGDWAYLQLSVLPNSADQFQPLWAGDSPSTDTIDIGGVEASVAQGETGWRISAPVGDSWVQLAVRASGLMTTGSRFTGMPEGAVRESLSAVAAEAFGALGAAGPERLAWPALEGRTGEAACTGGLDQTGIVAALQIDPAAVTEYATIDARESSKGSFEATTNAIAGAFSCELRTEGFGMTSITVVRGFAPQLAAMRDEADSSSAFEPLTLEGAVAPEAAIVAVRDDGPRSPVYFTLGDTLYEVYSDGSQSAAEAIIAQTR